MQRKRELSIGLLDLYMLREGWTSLLGELVAPGHEPDDCACGECQTINVETCIERVQVIQAAIRDVEAKEASAESIAANTSRRAN